MPVTLPRRGCGGGGPGRRGGRDGGRGHGGQGGPLPCHERNPMLASNSRISTLATSISPLPCTPAPSATVPPLLLLSLGPSMLLQLCRCRIGWLVVVSPFVASPPPCGWQHGGSDQLGSGGGSLARVWRWRWW